MRREREAFWDKMGEALNLSYGMVKDGPLEYECLPGPVLFDSGNIAHLHEVSDMFDGL